MKLRYFIYSGLLFVGLMLPFIYKNINNNIQTQEQITRQQQKNWLDRMVNIELDLASESTGNDDFWYHYFKALHYFKLELGMMKEDLISI